MERYSANLRFFFGHEASTVWSMWRERNRCLRSVELYRLVIEQLEADLKVEQDKRGTLLRVRSNEVTEVKGKLAKVSGEKVDLGKELSENVNQIDTLPERVFVRLKSMFTSSPGVNDIRESVVDQKKKLEQLDKELHKIAEELSKAVFKQNAAQDPIDDLEFAIDLSLIHI